MKAAATNDRNFRTFLLMAQLEARAIGTRIKQARLEAGMTQEDVADVATFSRRSLQDYENGVTIPWKHLREISALLDRPVEWLLHGDPEATPGSGESTATILGRLADLEARVLELSGLLRESLETEAETGSPESPGQSQPAQVN